MLVSAGGYELNGAPMSWSKVTAMRHALAEFPDAKYIWYLDQHSFIMNPSLDIDQRLMTSSKLEKNMIKDLPVVPPDSIIKTFSHLKGDDVEFVITQDKDGLSVGSFIIRNGEWAEFFLDTWFDPLYRTYNFQKAETHALVSSSEDAAEISLMLTIDRNTLYNGTLPFCPSWQSSPSGPSTHITSRSTAKSTRKVTL